MNDETAALPPTVYPSAKGRTLLMLLGAIAFVAVGAVLLLQQDGVKNVVVGAAAVLFFGLCAVLLLARLVQGRPELVLDSAGLEHVQLGRIGWAEIGAVRIRDIRVRNAHQRMIELLLHDPAGYLTRAPRLVRATASANRGLGYGPANISANTLPVGLEDVLAAMVRHHPRLVVQP
ncbi:STM3941 family protein [Kitasatospora sp. NPDC052868]|uniref:STM3941 family protein n=1 Tax=Kitasatospora sp. NPDC052868 TaxID=3364060 RepID=UPI0037C902CF